MTMLSPWNPVDTEIERFTAQLEKLDKVLDKPASPIDELAKVRAEIDTLSKREKALAKEVQALGPGEHKGQHVIACVIVSERETLDTKEIKAAMPDEWIERFTKRSSTTQVRFKPKV